jgi:carbonic anhydrase
MTATQILETWKEGNVRFREGRKIQRDFLAEQRATASGQFPAGVLLSCIDSRAPAEIQATTYTGPRTADNAAFVDAVARKNVELTMGNIRTKSPVIAELETAGAVKIAGAFHDVSTGAVDVFA